MKRHSLPPQIQSGSTDSFASRYSASPPPKFSVTAAGTGKKPNDLVTSRGDPPPYYSKHEILNQYGSVKIDCKKITSTEEGENQRGVYLSVPQTIDHSPSSSSSHVEVCKKNHPPTVSCKTCNNARSTYRKNAANLVRRASSGASLLKRKSAKLRSSFHTELDLDETPSILARLRKEWQDRKGNSKSTGNITNTEIQSSSTLRKESQSKSSEVIGYNIPNLSHEQWTIKENQAMTCIVDRNTVKKNHHRQSSVKVKDSERTIRDTVLISNPGIREAMETADGVPASKYFEVDVSDSDTTYDTLIIKDLSDLSESQSTDGSSSHDDHKVSLR